MTTTKSDEALFQVLSALGSAVGRIEQKVDAIAQLLDQRSNPDQQKVLKQGPESEAACPDGVGAPARQAAQRTGPELDQQSKANLISAHDKQLAKLRERWPLMKNHSTTRRSYDRHCAVLGGEPSDKNLDRLLELLKADKGQRAEKIADRLKVSREGIQALLFFLTLQGRIIFSDPQGYVPTDSDLGREALALEQKKRQKRNERINKKYSLSRPIRPKS